MKEYFFDIHCHVFNLSHPNLMLFIKRFLSEKKIRIGAIIFLAFMFAFSMTGMVLLITKSPVVDRFLFSLILILSLVFFVMLILLVFLSLLKLITGIPSIRRILNLVSVMENNLGEFLILMEKDIIKSYNQGKLKNKNAIITPLMMDFGYKWINDFPDIYYNRLSRKPITDQVIDLLNGIKDYKSKSISGNPVIEVYPFLGINTQNYPWDNESKIKLRKNIDIDALKEKLGNDRVELMRSGTKGKYLRFTGMMTEAEKKLILSLIRDKNDVWQVESLYEELNKPDRRVTTIRILLDKYFKEFEKESPDLRHDKLFAKMGKFRGDLNNKNENFNYFFAGIKVYPPLGFDPWPEDPVELKKVKYLYDLCLEKNIPITSHCGGGGFQVIDNSRMNDFIYYNWKKVLDDGKYGNLKINLAHFGGFKYNKAKFVFDLILNHENVFTDFSCQCIIKSDYKRLYDLIIMLTKNNNEKKARLLSRINFGTDFVINLLMSNSYCEYLENFHDSVTFTSDEKDQFCRYNPGKFLFG
jgi:hypothetical protein